VKDNSAVTSLAVGEKSRGKVINGTTGIFTCGSTAITELDAGTRIIP